ncbi:MAG: RHS repeat domain-containing protein [Kordia sp.]|uniref:RHS repeat domain-containing protein n=1 Tax=Kordia sp. TaxID=1965332 RepID=UPI00385F6EBC
MKNNILFLAIILSSIHFGLAQNITWGINNSFTLHEQTIFPGENYMYSNISDNSKITSLDRLLSTTTFAYVKVSSLSEFSNSPGGITLNNPPDIFDLNIILKPVYNSNLTIEHDEFLIRIRPDRQPVGGTIGGAKYSIIAMTRTATTSSTIASINNLTLSGITNSEVMIEKVGVSTINFKHNGIIFATTTLTDTSIDYNLSFETNTGQYFGFKYEFQGFDFSPSYYPCITGTENSDKNWISNCAYDINGNLKASGISYSDELGRGLQTQAFDISTGKRWISEVQYDAQGRPAFSTSSSPANLLGLEYTYKPDFTKKADGSPYTNTDWENTTPQAVGSQEESLGWYYSANNTDEPFQDITDYPFVKATYSTLNPGSTLKVEGGRQLDSNTPQGFSYTVPATQELYYVFGKDAFKGEVTSEGKELLLQAFKTIKVDPNGVENVIFKDVEGKILATARSGGTINYDIVALVGTLGYIDIHIPQNITANQISFENSAISDYTIYDLRTEQIVTSLTGGNFYRLELNGTSENKAYVTTTGTIATDSNAKGIRYPVNYYDYALNYYDDTGILLKATQPFGFNTSCLTSIQSNPIHNLESLFYYNSMGKIVTSFKPDIGTTNFKYRDDGRIRFSQNSKQILVNEFSYINYDNLGRPIESGVASGNFSTLDPTIESFTAANYKEQNFVTYDYIEVSQLSSLYGDYQNPSFLGGNIAKTQNDQTTTYYSYDIYGRVQWVVQDIAGLGIKTIDYEYDPITSTINKVTYQKYDANELFIHRYTYNSIDNSLIKVETSTDGNAYIEHAAYEYYETGELKNIQLAEGIQQIDYVYTLDGQLKSINHPSLSPTNDPGGSTNDMFGMTIDYFNNDYQRANIFPAVTGGTNQYNGNIKGITWNVDQAAAENPSQYTYEYNRENWLTEANFNGNGNSNVTVPQNIIINSTANPDQTITASNSISFLPGAHVIATTGTEFNAVISNAPSGNYEATDYRVSNITYDANGNIQTLNRNKNTENGSNAMDELSYVYDNSKPNQLIQVTDGITTETNANDIKNQTNSDNYDYNEIGQLVQNVGENIGYVYNASGLVTEVKKLAPNEPIVKFYYNDKNHRVKKESFSNGVLQNTTHYIRDAAGVSLAIYTDTNLVEHTIYGSSRLGVHYRQSDSDAYQLTDHLGNVRAVIIKNGSNAVSLTAKTDYYPFGMPMPNRHVSDGYRYAYQGQEKDIETGKEAFELRLWDSRIGRWLTTDPAGQYASPYLGMGNDPVNGIDSDGAFRTRFGAWLYRFINDTGGDLFERDNGGWGIDVSSGSYSEGVNIITGSKWEEEKLFGNGLGYFTHWNGWQPVIIEYSSPEPEHQGKILNHAPLGTKYLKSERTTFHNDKSMEEFDNKAIYYSKLGAETVIGSGLGKATDKEATAVAATVIFAEATTDFTVENTVEGVVHTVIYNYGAVRDPLYGSADFPKDKYRAIYDIKSEPTKVFHVLYYHQDLKLNGKSIFRTTEKPH